MQPLDGYVRLKRMEAQVADAMSKIKDAAIEQAAQYGKGEHEAFGAVVQCRAGAGRWKFDHLQWYKDIADKREAIDNEAKAKEDAARGAAQARERMQTIVDDDGVIVEPAVFVPGKDTVAISLKKQLKS